MSGAGKADIDSLSACISHVQPEPENEARAAWVVLNNAHNADDAQHLLESLGLDVHQAIVGRRMANRLGRV